MTAGPAASSNEPIQRIAPGPRMSGAVVHGNTVYLAGQVSQNAAGRSVTEQTEDILSIIDGLLARPAPTSRGFFRPISGSPTSPRSAR
jgi:enamine deaminase RidA (YjgF/YER057c/UK114 family)